MSQICRKGNSGGSEHTSTCKQLSTTGPEKTSAHKDLIFSPFGQSSMGCRSLLYIELICHPCPAHPCPIDLIRRIDRKPIREFLKFYPILRSIEFLNFCPIRKVYWLQGPTLPTCTKSKIFCVLKKHVWYGVMF